MVGKTQGWNIDWRALPWKVMRYRTFSGKKYIKYEEIREESMNPKISRSIAEQTAADMRRRGGLARITKHPDYPHVFIVWANPNGSKDAFYTIYDAMPYELYNEDGLYWRKESGW